MSVGKLVEWGGGAEGGSGGVEWGTRRASPYPGTQVGSSQPSWQNVAFWQNEETSGVWFLFFTGILGQRSKKELVGRQSSNQNLEISD